MIPVGVMDGIPWPRRALIPLQARWLIRSLTPRTPWARSWRYRHDILTGLSIAALVAVVVAH